MSDNNKSRNSLTPIGSTGLVRAESSIEITNKIIKEYEERLLRKIFTTKKIGSQEWMIKNLDVECYANGDPIPQVQNPKEFQNLKTGAWCNKDNYSENRKQDGKIYNWYAVADERGLAPNGFKVPSKKDWKILFDKTYEWLISENPELKDSKEYFTIMFDDMFFRLCDILITGYYHHEEILDFWTSTELNSTNAICVDFGFGGFGNHEIMFFPETFKYSGGYVRCIKG